MSFTFERYVKAQGDSLYTEKRLKAVSGYAIGLGQALKVSGGRLIYAQSADVVYAISNISAASSVVTADYVPEVYPVNQNQIWKGGLGSAITAAFVAGVYANLATSPATLGTSVAGDAINGSAMYVYDIATASTPTTSAVYAIFPDPATRA